MFASKNVFERQRGLCQPSDQAFGYIYEIKNKPSFERDD